MKRKIIVLYFFLAIGLFSNVYAQENISITEEKNENIDPNSNVVLQNNLNDKKSESENSISKSELSDALVGYLMVISILIATSGFVLGMMPTFGSDERFYYRYFSGVTGFVALSLTLYGIILILITGHLFFHLVAFGALLIPIGVILGIIFTRK